MQYNSSVIPTVSTMYKKRREQISDGRQPRKAAPYQASLFEFASSEESPVL